MQILYLYIFLPKPLEYIKYFSLIQTVKGTNSKKTGCVPIPTPLLNKFNAHWSNLSLITVKIALNGFSCILVLQNHWGMQIKYGYKAMDQVVGKQQHSHKITTTQVASSSMERLNSCLGQGKSRGLVRLSDVLLDLQEFHLYVNLPNDRE